MNVFVQNYLEIPTITRGYLTSCVMTTLLVQLDIVSPFQLYYNFNLIFFKHQYWRLITSFLFFGTFNFGFFFSLVFIYRHSRMLEEGSFRSKSADFLFMLLFGAFMMILIAPFVKLIFLGHAFTIMLVYLWSKRNPSLALNFFGIANFRAPNLPWILLGFSIVLGNPVLTDVLGIAVGHIYYYLEDVFPNLPGGFRILKTPKILVYLLDYNEYYENYIIRSQNNQNENLLETNQEVNQTNEQNNEQNNQINDSLNSNNTTNLNNLHSTNTNE